MANANVLDEVHQLDESTVASATSGLGFSPLRQSWPERSFQLYSTSRTPTAPRVDSVTELAFSA